MRKLISIFWGDIELYLTDTFAKMKGIEDGYECKTEAEYLSIASEFIDFEITATKAKAEILN